MKRERGPGHVEENGGLSILFLLRNRRILWWCIQEMWAPSRALPLRRVEMVPRVYALMARWRVRTALSLVVVCSAMLLGRVEAQGLLTLGDFNRDGLDVEVLILVQRTSGSGDNLWSRPRFDVDGILVDGGTNGDVPLLSDPAHPDDPAITDGNLISMRRGSGNIMILNDDGGLALDSYFGSGGAGNDLRFYFQTTAGVAYTALADDGVLEGVGGNYVNLELNSATATLTSIGPTSRFIFALARLLPNQPPVFGSETETRTVAEDAGSGVDVGAAVTATDVDPTDTLAYSISGDPNFSIVSTSGQIQVAAGASLDYEMATSHTFTVTASDGAANDTVTVTVNVTNVEEAGTVTLSAAQPVEGTAFTATLADPDGIRGSASWQWASAASANVAFGDIVGARAASYTPVRADSGMYLRATASYTDGHGSGKTAQVVSDNAVTALNDPPAFPSGTAARTVAENEDARTNVGAPVVASDPGDTVSYSITGANPGGFTVDSSTGQIRTGGRLDYETTDSYTFTVTASDTSNAADTVSVTVSVTDANDPPVFASDAVELAVEEGAVGGASVGPVTATDQDAGDTISYSLTGTTAFVVGTASGVVTVAARAILDHETTDSYSFTVTASDGEANDTVSVTVNVTDANDPPVFASDAVELAVEEGAVGGASVGPVTATDQDAGDTISYSLTGTTAFVVGSTSGVVTVAARAILDHETTDSYTFTVTASDGEANDTVTVTVNVTNVEEAGTVTLSAAQPVEGTAFTATLADPDGIRGSASWQWASAASASGAFGDIVGARAASYTPVRADSGMYLRATASYTDGHGSGKTAQVVSDNAVTALNDPPAFPSGTAARSVAENEDARTNVGAPVVASDPGDTVSYSITGANPGGFTIDSSTGQIRTGGRLDHETTDSYTFTVQAEDMAAQRTTVSVTVSVTDANDPPVFASDAVELAVEEGAVGGASVGAVTATDQDAGDTISYSLTGTTAFVVGTASGVVTVAARAILDHETTDSYSFTVTASDGEANDTVSVTVNVTDANDPPVFASDAVELAVEEGAVGGASVGPVTATDQDAGDTISYSLTGTTAFVVGSTSGVVTVAARAILDHETTDSYTFTVTASDGEANDTVTVTVNVTNVEEAGTVTLSAAQPVEGTAFTATLADPDGIRGSASWQWASAASASGAFGDIVGARAASYTPVPADSGMYLRATASYADGHGSGKTDQAVSDNAVTPRFRRPQFSNSTYTRTVAENEDARTNVGAPVVASDPGDTVSYSLSGAAQFEVVARTGQIRVAASADLDFETTPTYTVLITATDSHNLSSTVRVTINLTDVFENVLPDFGETAVTRLIHEDAPAGSRVGTPITASDPGERLEYTLSGPDAASFDIGLTTGQLTVGAGTVLDYETKTSYSVTVTATDPHNATDMVDVTIDVVDLDEAGDLGVVEFTIGCDADDCGFADGSYGTLGSDDYPEDLFDDGPDRTVQEFYEDADGFWYLRYSGGASDGWLSDADDLNSIMVEVSYQDGRDKREFVLGGFIVERAGSKSVEARPADPVEGLSG